MEKLSVQDYFREPETLRPMELAYGVVREPAMPNYEHQRIATRLIVRLGRHVEQGGIGEVLSSIDVVLDEQAALVVQPDIVFVSCDRLAIIRERVWGAPDLVIEILSPSTAMRDRTVKVGWYRQYGVRECWLIDVRNRSVEVVELQSTTPPRLFVGTQGIRTSVLPDWAIPTEEIFD